MKTNVLYYGDNLQILRNREYFPDESIDLVYLDPPFNSKKDYNLLFKESDRWSEAQMRAFSDTWHWTKATEAAYREFILSAPLKLGKLIEGMVDGAEGSGGWIGRNDVTAYLVMMTARLVEMHRVLKKMGSLYLHCDPTASHYLKLVLDQVFGPANFRREVVWRSGWVSGFKTAAKNWVRNHDTLLYYVKGEGAVFNKAFIPHPPDYRRRGGGGRKEGVPLDDVWTDIYSPWIMSFSKEKLGWATQKPLALLERIIQASSNEGDVVLDPFCGCGTAIVAAQTLNRRWIGIDVTHLAIAVMKNRLRDSFPGMESPEVVGEPVDLAGARELARQDRYQFQWWALSLLNARPVSEERKKGADKGIDGFSTFLDDHAEKVRRAVVQVKSGHIGVKDIRDLKGVVADRYAMGVFITLEPPTQEMVVEALGAGEYYSPLWDKNYPKIQILTVEELLQGKTANMPPVKPPYAKAPKIGERAEQLSLEGGQ